MPNMMMCPKAGSLLMPRITSVPRPAMASTSTPRSRAPGSFCFTPFVIFSNPTRASSAVEILRRTPPTSTLWTTSGEEIFKATGPPIFCSRAAASSALLANPCCNTGNPYALRTVSASASGRNVRPSARTFLKTARTVSLSTWKRRSGCAGPVQPLRVAEHGAQRARCVLGKLVVRDVVLLEDADACRNVHVSQERGQYGLVLVACGDLAEDLWRWLRSRSWTAA